jgi:hypothetical protein
VVLVRFGFASSAFTKPTAIQHHWNVVAASPRCGLLFKTSLCLGFRPKDQDRTGLPPDECPHETGCSQRFLRRVKWPEFATRKGAAARDLCIPHKDTKTEFEQKVTKFTKNREKDTGYPSAFRSKKRLRQYAGDTFVIFAAFCSNQFPRNACSGLNRLSPRPPAGARSLHSTQRHKDGVEQKVTKFHKAQRKRYGIPFGAPESPLTSPSPPNKSDARAQRRWTTGY